MGRNIIFTDEAEVNILDLLNTASADLTFHLFQNNYLVLDTTTLGDLTEADYTGYAAQPNGIGTPSSVADGFAHVVGYKATHGLLLPVFPGNSGADQRVYGAYATFDKGDGAELFWAGNVFDAEPTVSLVGRLISGPLDTVILAVRHYIWDYYQNTVAPQRNYILYPSAKDSASSRTVNIQCVLQNGVLDVSYSGTANITREDPTSTGDDTVTFSGGNGSFSYGTTTTGPFKVSAVDQSDYTIFGYVGLEFAF